jgi:hypothetical protein
LDGINCLRPDYDMDSILFACLEALRRHANGSASEILARGLQQTQFHSLDRERRLFLKVLGSALKEYYTT